MAETLLQKAQRLGVQPTGSSTGESLLDKAQRLGIKPVSQTETVNTQPLKSTAFTDVKTLYGGSEQGIAVKLASGVSEGAKDIQKGIEIGGLQGVPSVLKGFGKTALRTAGDVAGAVFAPIASGLDVATGGKINQFFTNVQKTIESGGGLLGESVSYLADNPEIQKFAVEHPNAGEDFGRALNILFSKGEKGNIKRAFVEPQTVIKEANSQIFKTVSKTPSQINQVIQNTFKKTPEQIINKRLEELNKIDSNYAQMRKASGFSDDALGSRKRVASTDVLANAVDDTGTIRTKEPNGAVEQYRALTLEQAENVVKNNLERLGEKTNLQEVKLRMENAVKSSGLEGSDLQVALNKIDSEINGLKLRAEANGDIPLSILQDAKISTTKNINYFTPPEVNTYRKAVAKAYKETIEKNSSLNVKEVNAELSKYLEDIAFLERLDGKKVQGGKLGKYFAQISGNIIGATAGGAIGGPVGSAIGTILGGETASRIKGSMLQQSLGGKAGVAPQKSKVLQEAIEKGKSPRLSLPAPKEGSPRVELGSGPQINLPANSKTLLGLEEIYSNSLGNRNQQ